ncbi:MAG: ABC transporter permease subunit [Clostridia bacterium]|nr:ABC transporter permease subunit [Clostridia bacterium]
MNKPKKTAAPGGAARVMPRHNLWAEIVQNKEIYLLALPAVIWYLVFCYGPMGGLMLAFKSFKAKLGILGSPWVGMANFESLFRDSSFFNAVGITLWINIVELLLCFPAPILLAIMLNELRMGRYKKILQTVFTFPHFLSWVIVGSIIKNLLSVDGVLNGILSNLGLERVVFLGDRDLFRPLIYITEIWKEAGWSSIIYLAAISGIEQQQYEAAEIDGASRLQRILYITLPSILPTVAVMLILQMGGIMGGHFDQIYNLQNDIIAPAAETLNLYIYRITFKRTPNYGFSTAVSLFCSVVNMVLLLGTNKISERFGGTGLMGGVK